MLIVLNTFDENHRVRTGFWVFMTTLLAIFLNNQFLIKDYRDIMISETERNLANVISRGPPQQHSGLSKINEMNESLIVAVGNDE